MGKRRKEACAVCGAPAFIGSAVKFCSHKHRLKYREERLKLIREKNKDQINAKAKQYYEKNKDRIKAQVYASRERNRGAYDAYQAKYRAEHAHLKRSTRGSYG